MTTMTKVHAGGRRRYETNLPTPDKAALTADGAAAVKGVLGRINDPERLLTKATSMVAAADEAYAHADAARKSAALSFWLYDDPNVLPSELARVTGLSRTALYQLVDGRTVKNTPRVDNAGSVVAKAAKEAIRAQARQSTARDYRDAAIRALVSQGWSRPRIGAIIGRDPSRVSHITSTHTGPGKSG